MGLWSFRPAGSNASGAISMVAPCEWGDTPRRRIENVCFGAVARARMRRAPSRPSSPGDRDVAVSLQLNAGRSTFERGSCCAGDLEFARRRLAGGDPEAVLRALRAFVERRRR
jgi:hypothetical protein